MDAAELREQLEGFLRQPIEVKIYGGQDEEPPVPVQKTLYKLENCPDHTHLRLYFDKTYFLAIPFDSTCLCTEEQFQAYDAQHELHYSIKKLTSNVEKLNT